MTVQEPIRRKAQLSPGLTGNPTSAAAVSCEQEAITWASSKPVVLAISGRSGPSSVPAGTRGGKSLGGNPRALSSRFDQVWVTGL